MPRLWLHRPLLQQHHQPSGCADGDAGVNRESCQDVGAVCDMAPSAHITDLVTRVSDMPLGTSLRHAARVSDMPLGTCHMPQRVSDMPLGTVPSGVLLPGTALGICNDLGKLKCLLLDKNAQMDAQSKQNRA